MNPSEPVQPPHQPTVWRTVLTLTLAGGAAFWLANFAISLTPIAAEYRAVLSISYVPMLIQALAGGLVLGFLVSVVLIRFFDRVPGRGPLGKSIVLSIVALVVVTLAIEVPAKLFGGMVDPMPSFVIGAGINIVRILALGVAIGVTANWAPSPTPTGRTRADFRSR